MKIEINIHRKLNASDHYLFQKAVSAIAGGNVFTCTLFLPLNGEESNMRFELITPEKAEKEGLSIIATIQNVSHAGR